MKRRYSKTRFTLIELLAVCGILILLMGIGIGVYSVANRKMGEAKCKAMIAKLSTALQNYYSKQGYYIQASTLSYFYVDKYTNDATPADNGTAWPYTINTEIPISSNELATKTYTGVDILPWSRGVWKDPFGNKYYYRCPGIHNPTSFDLFSVGPDQSPTDAQLKTNDRASTGDDITNWAQ
ncbi:MAG TPA: hypothetical protein DET40_16860 [Lentisphaeria bacterium]|nr:MAG: hypothetical protein A2X45_21360 [Lentisphaerae bacterium GWF2_50_93]HCE45212.1 hypothetical protein [Lentisphaeria bacterium]